MSACCRRHGALGHHDGACSPRLTLDDAAALVAAADEAEALADAATPGPWTPAHVDSDEPQIKHRDPKLGWFKVAIVRSWDRIKENAAFIAGARTAVPALATTVRALARQLAEVTRERDELYEISRAARNIV